MHQPESPLQDDVCARILRALEHLAHRLPGQAPIRDFVHHNTLHGYQHLPFPDALAASRRTTGAQGYAPLSQFRAWLQAGRIDLADLNAELDREPDLAVDQLLVPGVDPSLTRRDLYLAALRWPLDPIDPARLHWEIDERDVLTRLQRDLPAEVAARLLAQAGLPEPQATAELWSACLEVLGLERLPLHAEEAQELTPDQLRDLVGEGGDAEAHLGHRAWRHLRSDALADLERLWERVGRDLSLRGLLLVLSGQDLNELLVPYLIRNLANFLDQGLAPWHHRERDEGFYTAWRRASRRSFTWLLEGMGEWVDQVRYLPEDPLETVVEELTRLGLPQSRWVGYLERLALELPGWSGMVAWRERRPGYQGQPQLVTLLDYLAVRLVLERLFAQRLCSRYWRLEPDLDLLRAHFRQHPAEFLVRQALFEGRLPEHLATRAQRLALLAPEGEEGREGPRWRHLAQLIWTWRKRGSTGAGSQHSPCGDAWPLFRLAQHLGLGGAQVRALGSEGAVGLLKDLARLDSDRAGYLWLRAYERHFREQILAALAQNWGRGRWLTRTTRPAAQVVCCMDDREEGLRRHLEELNPAVETLGAAGFFGLPINWVGLDDSASTALCPVGVRPSHRIQEQPRADAVGQALAHRRRRGWRLAFKTWPHRGGRANPAAALALLLAAPAALAALAARLLAPRLSGRLRHWSGCRVDGPVATQLTHSASDGPVPPTPDHNRLGFTDQEQAERLADLLGTLGLRDGFAPLVVILGHGSTSENNPHRSAYDCGACSGRHGGPNARLFATLANRPKTRQLLAEQGIRIPDDCWFIGAFHNTGDEAIDWYDLDQVPERFQSALSRLQSDLTMACARSAQERCRKFVSAPPAPDPQRAVVHVQGRGLDLSQARPELGHATNAWALVGRRARAQGLFLDRRAFLVSYDPTLDPDGTILERLLLAVGPVGAGISLEYYFSTVDNDRYGAGSKITHNLAGLFGVMDGTTSDLRTGLPRQMIEIHEAMRLLLVVETRRELLSAILDRQPALAELVRNGWLVVAVQDLDEPRIDLYQPETGWEPWTGRGQPLARYDASLDYCTGTLEPLAPVFITQPGAV